jgi:Cu/Ag efflux protein CusF
MSKHWLRAVTALSIAAVALAFAAPVRGEEAAKPEKPKKHQWTGTIESIDASAGTVTLKKGEESKAFKVGDKTKYSTADKKEAALGDLKMGDKVTVWYTEDAGGMMAARIAPPEPPKKSDTGAKKEGM